MAFQTVLVSLLSLLFHDKMQLSLTLTGNIISLITFMGTVGIYTGGCLAQRIGEKKVIRFLLIMAMVLFAIASVVTPIIPFCIIFLLGIFCMMALGPSIETVVSNAVSTEMHRSLFSFTYLGSNVGYGFFVLIITNIYQEYLNFVCIGGSIVCVIMLCIFEVYQKLHNVVKKSIINKSNEEVCSQKNTMRLIKKNKILLLVVVLYCVLYSQFGFTVPLQLNQLWGESGVSLYGMLGVINAVIVIVGTPILTIFFAHKKERYILFLTGVVYGVSFLILSLPPIGKWIYIVWMVCFTLAEIMYSISISAYTAAHNHPTDRSKVYALSNVCVLVGYIIGQNLSGFLGQYSISTNFIIMTGISFLGGLICKCKLEMSSNNELDKGLYSIE